MESGGIKFEGPFRGSSLLPCPAGRWIAGACFLFALAVMLWLAAAEVCPAGDLSVVPLFDGERSDSLNLWGGPFGSGNTVSFFKQSTTVHSGLGAYQAILGSVPAGGSRFFQTFSAR